MEKLSIKDIQDRLLTMANVVNDICRRHHIPLYMVGGTMLGAIRHKGFIPWDDDMDFAVPIRHYDDLVDILRQELPNTYKCITFENSKVMLSSFYKVEDTSTIIDEPSFDLINEEKPGISIDIFPLITCRKEELNGLIKKIHNITICNRRVFVGSTDKNKIKNYIKSLIKKFVPYSSLSLNREIRKLMYQIEPGDYISIPVSPHYWNRLFPKVWFENSIEYKFETSEFMGPSDYDLYLKMLYCDYMKLPPKEKQIVHSTNIYKK